MRLAAGLGPHGLCLLLGQSVLNTVGTTSSNAGGALTLKQNVGHRAASRGQEAEATHRGALKGFLNQVSRLLSGGGGKGVATKAKTFKVKNIFI